MFTIHIDIYELDNGHSKLRILLPTGIDVSSEMSTVHEAIDEAYKTLARERIKWKS